MPSRGQSGIAVYMAWDTSANKFKVGDAANHTIFIKNDKGKKMVGYVPIPFGKNVAVAGGIAFVVGFAASAIKNRFQQHKSVQNVSSAVNAQTAKWFNPTESAASAASVSA